VQRALLVPAQHVMELAAHPVKLVIDVEHRSARVSEDRFHTLSEQRLTEYSSAAHCLVRLSVLKLFDRRGSFRVLRYDCRQGISSHSG
jgi:hypothetical protein